MVLISARPSVPAGTSAKPTTFAPSSAPATSGVLPTYVLPQRAIERLTTEM